MNIEILKKAQNNLVAKGIASRITNNCLYVVIDDVELELAEFEVKFQAGEIDDN